MLKLSRGNVGIHSNCNTWTPSGWGTLTCSCNFFCPEHLHLKTEAIWATSLAVMVKSNPYLVCCLAQNGNLCSFFPLCYLVLESNRVERMTQRKLGEIEIWGSEFSPHLYQSFSMKPWAVHLISLMKFCASTVKLLQGSNDTKNAELHEYKMQLLVAQTDWMAAF